MEFFFGGHELKGSNRNCSDFVAAYKPFINSLSKVELKRLELAKKQLRGASKLSNTKVHPGCTHPQRFHI
jgi:hypothetical protein